MFMTISDNATTMAQISVSLNCSSDLPLETPFPPTLLLCHILNQIIGQSNHTPANLPPYPSSLPFSPWKPGDAYSMGGRRAVQTRYI